MKKTLKFMLATLAVCCAFGGLVACEDEAAKSTTPPTTQQGGGTQQLQEITGITFTGATYTYDGTEKSVLISGELPDGVTATYADNTGTNAGVYNASVVLSGNGYQSKTLTATLTIEKAMITGVTFADDSVEYDGEEHSIVVAGNVPTGVSVAYTGNVGRKIGKYEATATLTGQNYQTLTLDAVLTIKLGAQSISEMLDTFGNTPDLWEYLPEKTFSPEYRAVATNIDYANFVDVSNIPLNGMGKQMNMVYTELVTLQNALGYVNPVYQALGTIKTLYSDYIDKNPDDYEYYEDTVAGFTFILALSDTEYTIKATIKDVAVEIFANAEEENYGARVQLTETTVLKYEIGADSLTVATTILNTSAVYTQFVRQEDETVRGLIYEFLEVDCVVSIDSTSGALIEITDDYTTLIGTKGDFIPSADARNCEVYRNSDGQLIGTEVYEQTDLGTYNTLWYPLANLTGITSIKKVDEASGTNADTIYINGCTEDKLHTEVYLTIPKFGTRKYDIEFKTMYFFAYDSESESYEKVEVEIPMLFIQEETLEDFEESFAKKNETALEGESVSLVVATGTVAQVDYAYTTLLEVYNASRELVTFNMVREYCGVPVQVEEE